MAKNYARTYLIGLCSHVECVATVRLSRLFTASLFTHAKEKASEAIVKHAGVVGRVFERREQEESSVLRGVQFSRDSTSAFNDRIKIRENRGL